MRKTKRIAGIVSAVFVVTMSAATMTAFAAETENTISAGESNYSYLAGQQRSASRNELYAQAATIEDERKAFLVENGIADTEYSTEAAAAYSYVSGRERGASYRSSDDTEQSEAQSGYSFATGRQRGSSYRH